MSISVYTVEGMTCDHCVAAVTREVAGLDGVDDVKVDLASGRLEVGGSAPEEQVAAAVAEAGYALAGRA